jgi:hypothetical protein
MADSVLVWIGGLVAGAATGVAVTYLVTGGGQQPSAGSGTAAGATGPTTPATPSVPAAPPATPGTSSSGAPIATSTPTPTVPAPAASPWVHPSFGSIPTNAHVRLSITQAELASLLASDNKVLPANRNGLYAALIGQLPSTAAGWPWIGTTPLIYDPGAALPSDWPADEPNASGNWHVDMVLTSGPFGGAHGTAMPNVASIWIYDIGVLQATKG